MLHATSYKDAAWLRHGYKDAAWPGHGFEEASAGLLANNGTVHEPNWVWIQEGQSQTPSQPPKSKLRLKLFKGTRMHVARAYSTQAASAPCNSSSDPRLE
eukprot:79536-Chlamydomonas_euryale.AAC.2